MNVASLIARSAQQHRDAVALRHGERGLTYGGLFARAAILGGAFLDSGVEAGDRVAILQANGIELVETLIGAWMAGLVTVPINSRAHPNEAAYIIEACGAEVVVCGDEYESSLRGAAPITDDIRIISVGRGAGEGSYERFLQSGSPLTVPIQREQDDPAWLFYTSGTTGRPKGATLTHRNLRQMVLSHLADVRSFTAAETVLHAAPLTHGSGLVLLSCLTRGTRNVIFHGRSFDGRQVLELIRSERVQSIAFLAPTQIVILNDAAESESESELESVCYGGAPMFAKDLIGAIERFGPVFVQIYGQGEAPMTISVLGRAEHGRFAERDDPRLTSAGVPRTDVEVRIADEDGAALGVGERGEVLVRGDVVMSGYWNDPDSTAAAFVAGWLRTGDVGMIDGSGFLHVLDRSKDLIISGGNNIYPREVEDAILELPAVASVAVIGAADRFWGENVHALVVLHEGERLTGEEVIAHCQRVLSSYKKPKVVEFLPYLPTNAYGKVLKRTLREQRKGDR